MLKDYVEIGTINRTPLLGQPIESTDSNRSLWEVNLQSEQFRFLQDHRFQDMSVLPGGAYIEMALEAIAASDRTRPVVLRDVNFARALLLSENRAMSVQLSLTTENDTSMRFSCCSQSDSDQILHASMQVLFDQADALGQVQLSEIKTQCSAELPADAFYATLEANGNQYAAQFQRVGKVWQGQNQALSELNIPVSLRAELDGYCLHPALLDACIQTMTATYPNKRRTFIFTRIDQATFNGDLSKLAWCYARLTASLEDSADHLTGHIQLLDETGHVLGELVGVQFQFLAADDTENEADLEPVAISATFTAEPVEEALTFWKNELHLPTKVKFAPYNQVFQQLLDPNSLLAQNKTGLNVTLLRLEDWLRNEQPLSSALDVAEREKLFDGQARHTLPNHLEIAHLNTYETEYGYREIFGDLCYMKHGITIEDGATIIDIGANIGLFSLFALQRAKDVSIYAFEPSPPVYKILDTNLRLYGSNVKAYNCGISDSTKEATFTFYEKSSVFSSFSANAEVDGQAIRTVITNMVQDNGASNPDIVDKLVDELMEGRLASESFTCQLHSLSDIIKENNIQHIDLLKIDAEKSELSILQGIEEKDWPKVKKFVIEVHDSEGSVIEAITDILRNKGFTVAIEEETYLHNSGLYNLFAMRPSPSAKPTPKHSFAETHQTKIRENVDDLIMAAKAMAEYSSAPHVVAICPASPELIADTDLADFYRAMEGRLAAELDSVSDLYVMKSVQLMDLYPVEQYYDAHSDQLGHIPYTPEFYSALGTMLTRKYQALRRPPYKVVVLDCDNTLWGGVCGEDGPSGIQLDATYQKLQSFMLDQLNNGLLLCLCSKNTEADVWAVFEQRSDMILTREHIVSARINWEPKSQNIKSLAEELQLGLDSFIFVDDNPIEIAEVQANCPDVLTLQLPTKVETIPTYLNHFWALDHLKSTAEDKQRTALYSQNMERERFRKDSMTLTDFLDSLNLEIHISELGADNLERVSQLTQRTNQFNFTTIRRSAGEIQSLCQSGELNGLVVEVSDRFGDYGLVGVLFYGLDEQAATVDTFLMSCRVLGRGVEHCILAKVGQIAQEHELKQVRVPYIRTQKNQPALQFIEAVGEDYKTPTDDGYRFVFPAADAAKLSYNPDMAIEYTTDPEREPKSANGTAKVATYAQLAADHFNHIATRFFDAAQILQSIETRPVKARPTLESAYVAPDSELEQSIAKIWQGVLGIDRVGIHDNFFEMGGTSLLGVRLIAQLRNELQVEMSIVGLFEGPTIHLMTDMLSDGNGQSSTAKEKTKQSRDRGARRRARRAVRSRSN